MRTNPSCVRHALLATIAFTLATSCVEPPPPVQNSDVDAGMLDMGKDEDIRTPGADASSDMPAKPEGAYISVNGVPNELSIEMEAYSFFPANIEVFDEDGQRVENPTLNYTYEVGASTEIKYNAELERFESSGGGQGKLIFLASHEGEALEFEVSYTVRSFSPRYRIARVYHAPYTEEIALEDLIRVAPSGNDEMSVHQWLEMLVDESVEYSFVEVDDQGSTIRDLDDTIRDGNPQRHDYLLTFTKYPENAPPPPLPITVFTHEPDAMSSGLYHHCKLVGGQASCWGANTIGQLGTSDYDDRLSNTPVVTDATFSAIGSGIFHMCGLSSDRQVYCWGSNTHSQSNRDDETYALTTPTAQTPPRKIFAPADHELSTTPVTFTQVTAGQFHTCGLSTRGVVYCWGDDSRGQLGFDEEWAKESMSVEDRDFPPIQLPEAHLDTRFMKISAGTHHTCALSFEGDVFCWGSNVRRQSHSTGKDAVLPTRVSFPNNAPALALWTGPDATCAYIDQGQDFGVYCWGDNSHNKLNDREDPTRIDTPTKLNYYSPGATPRPEIIDLEIGQAHGCSLSSQNDATKLHCWGLGEAGELGRGDGEHTNDAATNRRPLSVFADDQSVVTESKGSPDLNLDLSLLSNSTCLLDRSTGATSCWGEQLRGSLGDNASAIQPPPSSRSDYTRIENYPTSFNGYDAIPSLIKPALMLKSTCLLVPEKDWGSAQDALEPTCWGSHAYGQTGDKTIGIARDFDLMRYVDENTNASPLGLSATTYRACVVKQDQSEQWCWGRNRTSPKSTKLLTAREEFLLPSPHKYDGHANRDRVAMSPYNTCSWSPNNKDEPPICRGAQRYGALGNAVDIRFQSTWTGLDDGRDRIGSFTMENRYFDPSGTFNQDNQDTITHFELGTLTGCMIRKSATRIQNMPDSYTYRLWCWGDVEGSWNLASNPAWGSSLDYDQHNEENQVNALYRSYLPRILMEWESAEPPRSLALANNFGCMIDHDGALICWGSPPLAGDSLDNVIVGENNIKDDALPFEKPVQLFDGLEFWRMSASGNLACIQHASRELQGVPVAQPALTCFGANLSGQAGVVEATGTITQNFVREPLRAGTIEDVNLGGLDEIYQFTVGEQHVCVTGRFDADDDGPATPDHALEMACWGLDTHGQSRMGPPDNNVEGYVHTATLPQ